MPVSPNNLVDIINQNKNKKLLASKIIESNPKVLPILPKLVRDKAKPFNSEDDRLNINRSLLESIYTRIRSLKQNSENITKLFPDIELSIQILVSSILSPKKMTDIQLNYKLDKTLNINPIVTAGMLEKIKTYMNDTYEIEEKLPEIIREALFSTGAYVLAVIPESSVDDLINTDLLPSYSTEEFKSKVDTVMHSITRPVNILKPAVTKSISLEEVGLTGNKFVEHLVSSSFVNVTDNVNIFKFAQLKDKLSQSVIKSALKRNVGIAQESLDKLDYIDIFRQKGSTHQYKEIEFIKQKSDTTRKSMGRPMTVKIPTESVIPVFIPGDETSHIGYFVLLDESGKPLSTELKGSNFNQASNSNSSMSTMTQLSPVQKAYNNLVTDSTKNIDVNQLFDMYKDVLEKQLYTSIKNSLYGSNVEIANKNEIYFMMFTRALADQKTNMLFIPKELVVYFAFYYNEIGIGKSLLENLSVLSSLRAILLFSKIMAYSKQSIDVTKVNISLDPNDPDPEKTIEQIQDSVLKLRQNYFPLGINNPVDLLNWIQKAGLQFSYENNPLIPNVKIDFENSNIQHTIPSSDLEEELRKQTIIALGLSPETVDNGFSPDFATTVVNNNILLSKRVVVYQNKLIKHVNKLLSIVIFNDEDMRAILKKDILDNINELTENLNEESKQLYAKDQEGFINTFIDTLSEKIIIELPRPENTNLANLAVEFDTYAEGLDKVMNSTLSNEALALMSNESGYSIDDVKNVYRGYLLRKWCTDNNYFTEAFGISSNVPSEIEETLTNITEHLTITGRNNIKLIAMLQKYKLAIGKDYINITGDTEGTSVSDSPNTDSSDTDTKDSDDGESSEPSEDDLNLNF